MDQISHMIESNIILFSNRSSRHLGIRGLTLPLCKVAYTTLKYQGDEAILTKNAIRNVSLHQDMHVIINY